MNYSRPSSENPAPLLLITTRSFSSTVKCRPSSENPAPLLRRGASRSLGGGFMRLLARQRPQWFNFRAPLRATKRVYTSWARFARAWEGRLDLLGAGARQRAWWYHHSLARALVSITRGRRFV